MAGSLPALPEAIAPSLATTPDFARRASWSHAIEVKIIFVHYIGLEICSLNNFFFQVVTFEGAVCNIYIRKERKTICF